MNRLFKFASALTLTVAAVGCSSMGANAPQQRPYAVSPNGEVVKDPFGLCVRTGTWSVAAATQYPKDGCACDKALLPKEVCEPPAPPAPAPAPVAPPAPAAPAAPTREKVTFAADAFFDFDKAVLKPEGRSKLDELVSKLAGVNLEVIVAAGHTDSVGSDAYNQKLSMRRAEAVKTYLVSKGLEASRVYTEAKGSKQPVADNKTAAGRAKNRRVEVEVVGTRPTK